MRRADGAERRRAHYSDESADRKGSRTGQSYCFGFAVPELVAGGSIVPKKAAQAPVLRLCCYGSAVLMRLVLRIIGTWLLAIALILAVIDGTKSLAANALVLTPLSDLWAMLNMQSLQALQGFAASRLFGAVLVPVLDAVLNAPGFAVIGIPGALLALLGRARHSRRYVSTGEF
jgi:hypothetical protein